MDTLSFDPGKRRSVRPQWSQPGRPKMHRETIAAWKKLVALEPRLQLLLERARRVRDDPEEPGFCANSHWYGYNHYGFKQPMSALVGWEAHTNNPALRCSEAYDLASYVLFEALPNCRNCNCCHM